MLCNKIAFKVFLFTIFIYLQLQINFFFNLHRRFERLLTCQSRKEKVKFKKKSTQINLHYTRRITPKRVTSSGAHLRGLAPGLYSSEETSQRWQTVGVLVPI